MLYRRRTGAGLSLTETQEQILVATAAVIVRDGIDGTNMRNVAKEAEVSLGLLGYHFEGKQPLIVAAFQLACDRLVKASLAALVGLTDPADRVRAFVRAPFSEEFLDTSYLRLRLSLWAVARTDPDVAQAERTLWANYESQLAELIRQHDDTVSDAQATEQAVDVMIHQNGLWLDWGRSQNRATLTRGIARCEQLALAD